jgi:hypothetical protein
MFAARFALRLNTRVKYAIDQYADLVSWNFFHLFLLDIIMRASFIIVDFHHIRDQFKHNVRKLPFDQMH